MVAHVSGHPARCCSSVVEHSLGKGEVERSIRFSSTTLFKSDSIDQFGKFGGEFDLAFFRHAAYDFRHDRFHGGYA